MDGMGHVAGTPAGALCSSAEAGMSPRDGASRSGATPTARISTLSSQVSSGRNRAGGPTSPFSPVQIPAGGARAALSFVQHPAGGPRALLSSGHAIPLLGMGTWQLPRDKTADAVAAAIDASIRHMDCAPIYGNEEQVGHFLCRRLAYLGKRERVEYLCMGTKGRRSAYLWPRRAGGVPIHRYQTQAADLLMGVVSRRLAYLWELYAAGGLRIGRMRRRVAQPIFGASQAGGRPILGTHEQACCLGV
eukprot:scaffold16991_cov84-Isochrysis_galbana.AAC.1